MKDLTIRHDTKMPLGENTDKTFSEINCTSVFLGQSPKAIERKTKPNKWDLIKPKNFCTAKETIHKMKMQTSNSEKISVATISGKSFLIKIKIKN